MNSRLAGGGIFGEGGGWRHSYQWSCTATESVVGDAPTSYTVWYPDGRHVTFAANISTPYLAPIGVTDRFGGLGGSGYIYLYLTDGGKVRFYQTVTYHPDDYQPYWTFAISAADQIIDPHNQIITLEYTSGKLSKVTEPGGRYLKILYGSNGYVSEVDTYTAADHWTQWVKYTYATQTFGVPYVVLTKATYISSPGYPVPIATYTYQTSNIVSTGNPLISTCEDVRYPGPDEEHYLHLRQDQPPLLRGALRGEKQRRYCRHNSDCRHRQQYPHGKAR